MSDPARASEWRRWLLSIGGGMEVGVSWRSQNQRAERRLACTDLMQWASLFTLQGVDFICLQYGLSLAACGPTDLRALGDELGRCARAGRARTARIRPRTRGFADRLIPPPGQCTSRYGPGPAAQAARRASTTFKRAARTAGKKPPTSPMTMANTIDLAITSGVMTKRNDRSAKVWKFMVEKDR